MEAQIKGAKVPRKANSQKREKFVRLAQSRTVNAIKSIRVIGKLGNKSHYEYDETCTNGLSPCCASSLQPRTPRGTTCSAKTAES